MINFCKLLDGSTGFVERHFDPVDISEHRGKAGKVIWLDVQDPTEEDFALLKEEFDFHHLALDDCRQAHARPKLEKYDNYVFFVVYEVRPELLSRRLQTVELDIFFGANYVVTLHRGNAEVISAVETRWDVAETEAATEGSSYLAYLIIDAAEGCYQSAGVAKDDVDAYWFGTAQSAMSGLALGSPLKLHNKPVTRVENMCATGSEALRQAAYAVASS